jgi:hypothetical protein
MPIVRMPNGDQVRFPDDWSKEQIQAKIREKFPTVGARDVPIGGYVGGTLKGAAQAVAGGASTALDIMEGAGNLPIFGYTPPGFAMGEVAKIIPPDWRRGMEEFANAPYDRPGQELGYVGAQLGGLGTGAVKGGLALARGAKGAGGMVKGARDLYEKMPESVKTEMWNRIPGGWLRHIYNAFKEAGKVGEEAAPGAAKETGRAMPSVPERNAMRFRSPEMKAWREKWPEAPESAPEVPPAAKPRVRVPVQKAPEKYNFGAARDQATPRPPEGSQGD